MHAELKGKVFGGGQGEARGNDTLNGRVVRKVEEDHGTLEGAGALEVLHEVVRFFLGDTHGSEDHRERLGRTGHFCLAGDLERNIVVRQTCTREDREFLATDKGVCTVDRGDTGLDEIRRHAAGVRVNGRTGDVKTLLRHNFRTAVDRLAATGQDTAKHLPAHGHLDGLAGETDTAVPADTGRGLEDLDHHEIVARVEDLSALDSTVVKDYVHKLLIGYRLCLLYENKGAGNLTNRPVFLHAADLRVLNSASICFSIFASSGL